jgi:hypothetical protein
MAISITTLNGTDSVSSSRITINDNFTTVLSALNKVLNIIDISTGKINNSTFGSNNDIETEDLVVKGSATGGITVQTGNVTLLGASNITLTNGKITIGSAPIERITKTFSSGAATIPTLNISGIAATGGVGTVGYLTIPRLATTTIETIATPHLGSLVYDTSTNKLKVCTVSGATGTWTAVH